MCEHQIYCLGDLLDSVQTSGIYHDSKQFVDQPGNGTLEAILLEYDGIKQSRSTGQQKPNVTLLRLFLDKNFFPAGGDLEPYAIDDSTLKPWRIHEHADMELNRWAYWLQKEWTSLMRIYRQPSISTSLNTSTFISSSFPLTHPFAIPGGRFREFYYWDTFWIIKGMLASKLYDSVKGMLLNFKDMLDRLGFIPNGSRIYYQNRSQPPFFALMVEDYFSHTRDFEFLATMMTWMEKEYEFWMVRRSVVIPNCVLQTQCRLNLYNATGVRQPRPESYAQDLANAHLFFPDESESRVNYYASIATAAESGWDFSSRWLTCDASSGIPYLKQIVPQKIIPVDLNAILGKVELSMARMYAALAQNTNDEFMANRSNYFYSAHFNRSVVMTEFMFDNGTWWDLDVVTGGDGQIVRVHSRQHCKFSSTTYPSSLFPIWAELLVSDKLLSEISARANFTESSFNGDLMQFTPTGAIHASEINRNSEVDPGASYDSIDATSAEIVHDATTLDSLIKATFRPLMDPMYRGAKITMTNQIMMKLIDFNRTFGNFSGGIPASLLESNEQWDFPNAWPPIQWLVVESLLSIPFPNSTDPRVAAVTQLASSLVRKWIGACYCGWSSTGYMYEKYNVLEMGKPGSGGEYEVQDGFGWTNGVILDWLYRWSRVRPPHTPLYSPSASWAGETLVADYTIRSSFTPKLLAPSRSQCALPFGDHGPNQSIPPSPVLVWPHVPMPKSTASGNFLSQLFSKFASPPSILLSSLLLIMFILCAWRHFSKRRRPQSASHRSLLDNGMMDMSVLWIDDGMKDE